MGAEVDRMGTGCRRNEYRMRTEWEWTRTNAGLRRPGWGAEASRMGS